MSQSKKFSVESRLSRFSHTVPSVAECFAGLFSRADSSEDKSLEPFLRFTNGHRVESIEQFGAYVVRQLGVPADHGIAPALTRAANDYLRGDKSTADTSRDQLLSIVESAFKYVSEEEMEDMACNLIDELDACMLTYFAFHWDHADLLISQAINGPKKKMTFKAAVRKATSIQRVKKVIEHLGPQRKLSVLLNKLRLLAPSDNSLATVPSKGEVLVPATESTRCPVLLLIGGGMGAGKSTVVKEIMRSPFWSKVAPNAVVVEADAFKEKDVVYQALLAEDVEHISKISQMVHESSTSAASALLVTALNDGRDVIFDGTMSWAPFVTQTVEMARQVHSVRYRMGPGYKELPGGKIVEQYWEPAGEGDEVPDSPYSPKDRSTRKPYRIEMVGVVCDAHLAVMRGMRRAILTGRGVPVEAQLKSHRMFSGSLQLYSLLVDKAAIYSTNDVGRPAELIAYKEGSSRLLYDPEALPEIERLSQLNSSANNALELFPAHQRPSWRDTWQGRGYVPGRAWKQVVAPSTRKERQQELREALLSVQACAFRLSASYSSEDVPKLFPQANSLDGFQATRND